MMLRHDAEARKMTITDNFTGLRREKIIGAEWPSDLSCAAAPGIQSNEHKKISI